MIKICLQRTSLDPQSTARPWAAWAANVLDVLRQASQTAAHKMDSILKVLQTRRRVKPRHIRWTASQIAGSLNTLRIWRRCIANLGSLNTFRIWRRGQRDSVARAVQNRCCRWRCDIFNCDHKATNIFPCKWRVINRALDVLRDAKLQVHLHLWVQRLLSAELLAADTLNGGGGHDGTTCLTQWRESCGQRKMTKMRYNNSWSMNCNDSE